MSSPTPESDFGNSYHQLVKGQIYDAEAAANPDPLGPQGISGERAVTDLKNLQRDNESGKTARTILKSAPLNYTIQK
jgi:hypothetical protein